MVVHCIKKSVVPSLKQAMLRVDDVDQDYSSNSVRIQLGDDIIVQSKKRGLEKLIDTKL